MNASPVRHLFSVLAMGLAVGCGSSSDGDAQSGSSDETSTTAEHGTSSTMTTEGTGSDGSTGTSGDTTGVDEGSSSSGGSDTGSATCTVVYVNFEGVTLSPGDDDSRNDVSGMVQAETAFAPYGGDEDAEMIALVRDLFEAFDVCVTRTRPTVGDYTMVVVTPTNMHGGGVFGMAPNDCGNSNPNNIVFAFTDVSDGGAFHGRVIAYLLGIAFGLDIHEDDVQDLLHFAYSESALFQDACMLQFSGSPYCEHPNSCEGGQNSYQELLATLGPAGG